LISNTEFTALSFAAGGWMLRSVRRAGLEYISSAGLGILLKTQKRLVADGGGLKIINVNNHIHDVFRYSGFHTIFDIRAK
jgi:anti-anti-sigma factor